MARQWFRVKDRETGHEYTVAKVDEKRHTVLDKAATRRNGDPLPPKMNRNLADLPGGPAPRIAWDQEAGAWSLSADKSSGEASPSKVAPPSLSLNPGASQGGAADAPKE